MAHDFGEDLMRAARSLGFLAAELPDEARSAESAIRFLIDRLVTVGHLRAEDAESAAQAVIKRERLGSTAVGQGLAVPHAVIPSVERVVGAVGRCPDGMPWDSPSGASVRSVCLVLGPPGRPVDYMRTLEQLAVAAREAPY